MVAASSPLISVALPVHNGEDYLESALDSLTAQTFTDFEVVVSDNASTDRTSQILASWATRDERIRVSRSEVFLRQADNVSRAAALGEGRWIKFLCHDDLLDTTCLARLAGLAETSSLDVGLIGHGERWLFSNGCSHQPESAIADFEFRDGRAFLRTSFSGHSVVPLPSLTTAMVRSVAWESMGGFDPRFVHFDHFLWVRLLTSWGYAYTSEPLSTNRIHPAQVAVAARRSLTSVSDHRTFWREFLRAYEGELSLPLAARGRLALKPHNAAATALAVEMMKGRPRVAGSLIRQLPRTMTPPVVALTPLAIYRERRRTRDLRQRVPIHLIYP